MSQATATATTAQEPKLWGGGRSPFNVSYGKVMIWFFLLSDALTFGAFLISYGTTRFFSAVWPDANQVFKSFPFMGDTPLPLVFVSLMTFILIMSSVFVVRAVQEGHRMNRKGVMFWMFFRSLPPMSWHCRVRGPAWRAAERPDKRRPVPARSHKRGSRPC